MHCGSEQETNVAAYQKKQGMTGKRKVKWALRREKHSKRSKRLISEAFRRSWHSGKLTAFPSQPSDVWDRSNSLRRMLIDLELGKISKKIYMKKSAKHENLT